jgi:hypothetical protein
MLPALTSMGQANDDVSLLLLKLHDNRLHATSSSNNGRSESVLQDRCNMVPWSKRNVSQDQPTRQQTWL